MTDWASPERVQRNAERAYLAVPLIALILVIVWCLMNPAIVIAFLALFV